MDKIDGMEKNAGKMSLNSLFILFLAFFYIPSTALGLEKMDKAMLKAETGQAGIDIGLDNVVIYHGRNEIRVSNPSDPDNNYVGFENIKGLGVFETGASDIDNDGIAGKLTVDIGNINQGTDDIADDIPLVFLSCPDWTQNINIMIGNVNWCGKSIGSLDVRNFELPSWHAYIGSYNGTGIRYQLGFRTSIEEIRFNYGTEGEAFSIKGIQAAGTFMHDASDTVQDNPADPSTWKAIGEFKIGDAIASSPNPATIDFGVRETDEKPFIQLGLSASGSVRASDVQFGSQSFGPMAIDGIQVHSMRMELPGRGLGGN